MQGFLYKVSQFMYGRNGIDGLSIFIFVLSFIIRNISYYSRNSILNLISIILSVLVIYRVFSKDLLRRRKENDVFMRHFNKISYFFKTKTSIAKERARTRATHKIYKCPKCKRVLKVPKGKGKIEISCPCSNKFIKRT